MKLTILFSIIFIVATIFIGPIASKPFFERSNEEFQIFKRAETPVEQAIVLARLQELLGREAFSEMDTHGRLSNLQRLG